MTGWDPHAPALVGLDWSMLEARPDIALTPIDGGWRVRLSADGRHHIDVVEQIYNWRLVTTPVDDPTWYPRGWCYFGHGPDEHGRERTKTTAFVAAVMAARAWDGADDTEPPGYDRALPDAR